MWRNLERERGERDIFFTSSMATSKGYFPKANHRFLSGVRDAPPITSGSMFELDESEVWSSVRSSSPELRKLSPGSRIARKRSGGGAVVATAASLPVNVPDWSKILKQDYKERSRKDSDDDLDDVDVDDDRENWIPPHEFLARTRIASLSVHEGRGRTLKGRDLSRVRNAIWEKIGFQD
ncbi:hypothetical protein NMG60_11015706 [Bertholletia excelsa]